MIFLVGTAGRNAWVTVYPGQVAVCALPNHHERRYGGGRSVACPHERHSFLRNVRLISLPSALYQSTTLAISAQTSHWLNDNGTVLKATFKKRRLTTATCNRSDNAMAAQSHLLAKGCANADVRSERALKALDQCARTSTMKPAVRAVQRSCLPSISPPGRYRSIVSSVTIATSGNQGPETRVRVPFRRTCS